MKGIWKEQETKWKRTKWNSRGIWKKRPDIWKDTKFTLNGIANYQMQCPNKHIHGRFCKQSFWRLLMRFPMLIYWDEHLELASSGFWSSASSCPSRGLDFGLHIQTQLRCFCADRSVPHHKTMIFIDQRPITKVSVEHRPNGSKPNKWHCNLAVQCHGTINPGHGSLVVWWLGPTDSIFNPLRPGQLAEIVDLPKWACLRRRAQGRNRPWSGRRKRC